MKIIPSIFLLVICFIASNAWPALNREAEDSDEVVVPLDEEPLVIAGRWAPLGFNVNFSPWYNPFTSGISDLLKHVNTQLTGAMGNNQTNSTSRTEVIDGRKVTVNETMFVNKKTGTAFHMKVIDVQPASDSKLEDSQEQLPMAEGEDNPEMEDSGVDSTNGEERMEDWLKTVKELIEEEAESSKGESVETSNDKPMQSVEEEKKLESPIGVGNSSESTESKEKVAGTTEMNPEAAKSTEVDLDNEINHKEEDTETYYIPHNAHEVKFLERRGYFPHVYDDDANNEVDVFETYKPINMERDTLVNQLMSEKQHQSGLVMIDPDAELFDVKDGAIIKTYYNPHQRFEKIVT